MHIIVKQRDNQRKNFDLKLASTHAPVLWAAINRAGWDQWVIRLEQRTFQVLLRLQSIYSKSETKFYFLLFSINYELYAVISIWYQSDDQWISSHSSIIFSFLSWLKNLDQFIFYDFWIWKMEKLPILKKNQKFFWS